MSQRFVLYVAVTGNSILKASAASIGKIAV